ncbi:hypothetical protein L596_022091 [Steinernema carpocapsae]|uniref:Uncharacterized protein n=1 Tax=Steinernema carpocapsae TaxID=34508 RepID=A0A4U5MKQ7_STECR|nr:hypothetical protein L596_022091 [Steinernema carpocapsae]
MLSPAAACVRRNLATHDSWQGCATNRCGTTQRGDAAAERSLTTHHSWHPPAKYRCGTTQRGDAAARRCRTTHHSWPALQTFSGKFLRFFFIIKKM